MFKQKAYNVGAMAFLVANFASPLALVSTALQASMQVQHFSVQPALDVKGKECVKNRALILDAPASQAQWTLLCPLDEIVKLLEKNPQPALALIALTVIENEVIEQRSRLSKEKMRLVDSADPWYRSMGLLSRLLGMGPARSDSMDDLKVGGLKQSDESRLLLSTDELISDARKIVATLPSYLDFEGAVFLVRLLGESGRIEESIQELESHRALWQSVYFRDDHIPRMEKWLASSDSAFMREWLKERLSDLASESARPSDRRNFEVWLAYFRLLNRADFEAKESDIKRAIQGLYRTYAGSMDQRLLQETLRSAGAPRRMWTFSEGDMTFEERMDYSKSLQHALEANRAERLLTSHFSAPASRLSLGQRWELLHQHVRLLRLKDERPKIAALIERYKKWASLFSDEREAGVPLQQRLIRRLQMAKYYWTYGDAADARSLVEEVISLAGTHKDVTLQLGEARYLMARIVEQTEGMLAARKHYESALPVSMANSFKEDLLWRYFFLRLDTMKSDQARKELPELLSILSRAESFVSAGSVDWTKVHYWRAFAQRMASKEREALVSFRKAYELEPYSYYSNLAALEIQSMGRRPTAWSVARTQDSDKLWPDEPEWSRFVRSNAELTDPAFASLAQSYFLIGTGQNYWAQRSLVLLEREMYRRLRARGVSKSDKAHFGHAVAWLRLSNGDAMGALRAAELLRQVNGGDLLGDEALYLYPRPYWRDVRAHSLKANIEPYLVLSLIRQESAFDPNARSHAHAMGLMQMIPPVAEEEAKLAGLKDFHVEQLYQPEIALKLGVRHLRDLLISFSQSWIPSIASYNAGSPPVRRWLEYYNSPLPLAFVERISYSETRGYVKSILRNYMNYNRFYEGTIVDTAKILSLPPAEFLPAGAAPDLRADFQLRSPALIDLPGDASALKDLD